MEASKVGRENCLARRDEESDFGRMVRRGDYWRGECYWWRAQCEAMFDKGDVEWFADNADEYFAKWLNADSRIRAAVEALNDGEQWCTKRVTRALAALTTGDSGALPDSPAAPPEEEK